MENGADRIAWDSRIDHAENKISLYFPRTTIESVGVGGRFFSWLGYCFYGIARIVNN